MRNPIAVVLIGACWAWILVWAISAVRTKLHGGHLLGYDDDPVPNLNVWSDETVEWHRRNTSRPSGRRDIA